MISHTFLLLSTLHTHITDFPSYHTCFNCLCLPDFKFPKDEEGSCLLCSFVSVMASTQQALRQKKKIKVMKTRAAKQTCIDPTHLLANFSKGVSSLRLTNI